jgi:hypothetical protein
MQRRTVMSQQPFSLSRLASRPVMLALAVGGILLMSADVSQAHGHRRGRGCGCSSSCSSCGCETSDSGCSGCQTSYSGCSGCSTGYQSGQASDQGPTAATGGYGQSYSQQPYGRQDFSVRANQNGPNNQAYSSTAAPRTAQRQAPPPMQSGAVPPPPNELGNGSRMQ